MELKDLKLDERNYRKHNDENIRLIKKSIDECKFGRSVVIDNDNEVICGNGVVSAIDENTPIKVIETDGSELVVIKRKDLKRTDEKRDKLAILDNSTGLLSDWDYELLQEDFEKDYLEYLGVQVFEQVENIEQLDDIELVENYNESYNIIIKCKNYDLAQEFNQKYQLGLDFDNQRIVINVEKML